LIPTSVKDVMKESKVFKIANLIMNRITAVGHALTDALGQPRIILAPKGRKTWLLTKSQSNLLGGSFGRQQN